MFGKKVKELATTTNVFYSVKLYFEGGSNEEIRFKEETHRMNFLNVLRQSILKNRVATVTFKDNPTLEIIQPRRIIYWRLLEHSENYTVEE